MSFWSTLGSIGKAVGNIAGSVLGIGKVGDAIGAIGGAASEIGAQRTQQDAINKQYEIGNKQIQAQYDINQQNIEESERARQWQESMFDKQNEYNSASAVAERYREAGMNPYLMMSNGSGVSSAQTPSAPAVPQLQAPDMSGVGAAAQMQFNNALQQAQVSKALSESAQTSQQMFYYGQDLQSQIFERLTKAKNESERVALLKQMAPYEQMQIIWSCQQMQQSVKKMEAEVPEIVARTRMANASSEYQEIRNKYADKIEQATFDNLEAEIDQRCSAVYIAYLQGELTKQQCKTEIAKQVNLACDSQLKIAQKSNTEAATEQVNIQNSLESEKLQYKSELASAYVSQMQSNADILFKDAEFRSMKNEAELYKDLFGHSGNIVQTVNNLLHPSDFQDWIEHEAPRSSTKRYGRGRVDNGSGAW